MTRHLVVVDMQNIFGTPNSAWHAPRFDEILEPIDRLVAAHPQRVLFTRFLAPSEPLGAWRDYYAQFPFAVQPPDAWPYALVDRYRGRPTLDSTTFGKWGPALAERINGCDEIVVAGVSTDCCVISTVLAAADAGVRVHVAADACAGATDESHEQALAIMRLYAPLVEVINSADC
jgi:nicotinamidase-related amidase